MRAALIIILLVIANLTLYWVFYGKKKFEEKVNGNEMKTFSIENKLKPNLERVKK